MFVNLHTLPAGKSMYTLYVTAAAPTTRSMTECDEVDATAKSNATWGEVASYGQAHPDGTHLPTYLMDLYGPDVRIVGIVNQTDAFVLFDAFDGAGPDALEREV